MAGLGCNESMKILIPQASQILTVFKKDKSPIHITLDGGATGSFVKLDYAIKNKFKIWNNNQSAGLADNITNVKCVGYVEEIFYRDNWSVSFKGLVCENLKADIYGGQPFLVDNDIIQRSARNIITVHGKYTVMQTNPVIPATQPGSAALITLAKLNIEKTVLYPGQSIKIPIPSIITTEKVVIEPRVENKIDSWPAPFIADNIDGYAKIVNEEEDPIILPNDVNLISISECTVTDTKDVKQIKHESSNMKHRVNHLQNINKCINEKVLSLNQTERLRNIHEEYGDVFDGKLTGYNGYYGKHIVTLQWADDTRPKTERVHTPKWSTSKDVLLQKKIDQLTDMGVLTDPYEHNIQVKAVHPCFLQKKARAAGKTMDECDISEVRFLTAPNIINELCRQVQTKVPDQMKFSNLLERILV